ncbi:MAG: hypothetical protein JWM81_899 [Candidatus Saccharibacteria bacterium]|nr:hypothetical protein [Candidatus Saccharibacteria bacterium]
MDHGNPFRLHESSGGGGAAVALAEEFEAVVMESVNYNASTDASNASSIPAQRNASPERENPVTEVLDLRDFRAVRAIERRMLEDEEFSLFMAAAALAPEEEVSEAYFTRAIARAKEFETRRAQKEAAAAADFEDLCLTDHRILSALDLIPHEATPKLEQLSAAQKLTVAKGMQAKLSEPAVAQQVTDLVHAIDDVLHPKYVSNLTQLREETAHRRHAAQAHQPTRVEQALDQGAHVIDVTQRLAKKGIQAAKEVDVTKAAASTLVATALVGAAANGLTATSSLGGGRSAASVSVSGHAVSVSSLMPAKPGNPTELATNAVVLESYSKEVTARAAALPEVSQTPEVAKTIGLIDVSLSEKATTFVDSTSNPNSKKAIIASEAIAHAELHHPGQAIPPTDRVAILAAPKTPEITKAAQDMAEILQSTDTANALSPDEQKVIAAMYVHMATYASPEVKSVAIQAVTAAAEALPTDTQPLVTPAAATPSAPAAPETKAPAPVAPATPGTDPLVPAPTPSPNTAAPAPNERVLHPENYKGKYVTAEQIATIEKFRPEYEKAAKAHGLPWELIASIHLRETNLSLVNPGNGQGLFQFVAEAGAYPAGPISPENFDQQLDHLAQRLADNYATRGPNRATLTPDAVNADRIKDVLFSYNGRKDNYEAQAAALGFDPVNQGYEGSPYVMNLADDLRNSDKNPNWLQAGSDHGEDVKAGKQPGAWLMFNDIATASGLKVEASTSAAPHLVPTAPEQPPTDQTACAPGTRDIGMNQFWVSGKETMGRLCAIPGFKSSGESSDPKSKYYVNGANGEVIVAARASETWLKAFTDAQADGVDLSAISSYRPHQQQIDLCQADAYCKKGKAPGNNRNVAYAGTGEHEKGEAVDILDSNKGMTANCTGLHEDHSGRCIAPDDKRWLWMLHNGADHNLAQYIGESWHWKLIKGGLK